MVDKLTALFFYMARLITETIEGLSSGIEHNLQLHRNGHQLEGQVGHTKEWSKLLEA